MKSIVSLILAVSLGFQSVAFSQIFSSQTLGGAGGSDYWVGKSEGKPMITVDLWGGVKSPGVYHLPVDTTITKLIAYAGGPVPDAQLDEVGIRRVKGKDEMVYMEIDLEKLSKSTTNAPLLNDKDVITIPVSRSFERTAQVLSITTALLAIILSTRAVTRDN